MLGRNTLGTVPGAFKEAFRIEHFQPDDSDDDTDPDEDDDQPRVLFTREERIAMRTPP